MSRPTGDDGGSTADEMNNDRYEDWRKNIENEVILMQNYYVGLDSTEFLGLQPGQLSREDKLLID
ncbi:MAG: hypothetical protein M3H12_06180, partial [Chromatiales bacterium]